jgi:tetratricopeptide (TPR) repeat protein
MKTQITTFFILITSGLSFAQSLQDGIYKTENERFTESKETFDALIAKESSNGAYYFYKAENFYEWYQVDKAPEYLDSAKATWLKGIALSPENPLSTVAQGKIQWLNNDQTGAKATFTKALSATKNKNAEVMRAIAETYIEFPVQSLDDAISVLTLAIKLDPKNEDSQLLMGDALLAKTPENASEAIKYYNEVLKINAKSPRGIVRVANIYRRAQNYDTSKDYYEEAISIDATYAPAYREIAELYFSADKGQLAIQNWEKYLELNNGNEARYRYASSLYIAGQFCDAIKQIESLQAANFNNYFMERILAYCYYECNQSGGVDVSVATINGLNALERYFSIVPSDKIIFEDYKYKGKLLSLSGSDSLAIIELSKGYELNPTAYEILGEIGKMYSKAKNYNKVIEIYNKKKSVSELESIEYYELGRANYYGPKNYAAADSAFTKLTEMANTYYPGFLFRARCIYFLDTVESNYSQKPHFEKVYELITEENKGTKLGKTAFMESAKYLGRYYTYSPEKDIVKAKEFYKKIIEIDPNDADAAAFFKENP